MCEWMDVLDGQMDRWIMVLRLRKRQIMRQMDINLKKLNKIIFVVEQINYLYRNYL